MINCYSVLNLTNLIQASFFKGWNKLYLFHLSYICLWWQMWLKKYFFVQLHFYPHLNIIEMFQKQQVLWGAISIHIGVELGGGEGEVPLAELLRGGEVPPWRLGHPNDIKRKNWKACPEGGKIMQRGGQIIPPPPWPSLVLRPWWS